MVVRGMWDFSLGRTDTGRLGRDNPAATARPHPVGAPSHSSPLKGAGDFRDAGLVEKLDAGGGAKRIPVADGPDDFFIRSDFDDLNDGEAVRARTAAIAQDGVSAVEAIGGLDDAQFDAGQVVFFERSSRNAKGPEALRRHPPPL
jgi:hypothetical protein